MIAHQYVDGATGIFIGMLIVGFVFGLIMLLQEAWYLLRNR